MNDLVECLWKTSLATGAVWILNWLLRRQSAAFRHSMWLCALTAFLAVPALLPLAHRGSFTLGAVSDRVRTAVPAVAFPSLTVDVLGTKPPAKKPASAFPLQRVLLVVWLSGALLLTLRRLRAAMRMKRISSRSTIAPHTLTAVQSPPVRISPEIHVPLTWGLFRPLILLPEDALEWSRERLDTVLEHEREHIRRRDSLSHWLAEAVCAAWWFHPLAWLARNRAAHERECACDDAVLRSGVRPSDYASELVNLASTLPNKGEPIMALSALSNFERRIKNLLLPDVDRRPAGNGARLAAALAALAVIVPLSMLHAQAPVGQGELSGTVFDITGARIPNAFITASGSTGNREITRSNAAGEWKLSAIPSGDYKIEVKTPGFVVGNSSIALAPGQRTTVDQTMSVGSVQEMIEVVAQGQARRMPAETGGTPQRLRVGGNVQATRLLKQVKPVYPDIAKAQGVEGTVLLAAVIGKDGSLLSLKVMNKLADPDLAAAAMAAAEQWRYQPTLLNGEPVEVATTITINFKLQM